MNDLPDAKEVLASLKEQAAVAAREFDLDQKIDDARAAVDKVRERIDSDPKARNAAIGAGGVLLAGLLGTRGGRRLVGTVAKTGAVAALGALAYKAFQDRKKEGFSAEDVDASELRRGGYAGEDMEEDQDFALAILRAMLASAYADGVLDAYEQRQLDEAFDRAGLSATARKELKDNASSPATLALIADAARSPNQAAELYAAAVVAAGETNGEENKFLNALADRLGVDKEYAAAIRREAS